MWVHYNASPVSVALIRMLPGALVLPVTLSFCFAKNASCMVSTTRGMQCIVYVCVCVRGGGV